MPPTDKPMNILTNGKRNAISMDELHRRFRYEDGKLYWRLQTTSDFVAPKVRNSWNTKYADKEAGSRRTLGQGDRWVVSVNCKGYFRSVLIYAYHNGWPDDGMDVDHINQNRMDDRIENLRLATRSQNNANSGLRTNNTSGCKGVVWMKRDKLWLVRVTAQGKTHHVGRFTDLALAHAAYEEAAKRYFGEYASARAKCKKCLETESKLKAAMELLGEVTRVECEQRLCGVVTGYECESCKMATKAEKLLAAYHGTGTETKEGGGR